MYCLGFNIISVVVVVVVVILNIHLKRFSLSVSQAIDFHLNPSAANSSKCFIFSS